MKLVTQVSSELTCCELLFLYVKYKEHGSNMKVLDEKNNDGKVLKAVFVLLIFKLNLFH